MILSNKEITIRNGLIESISPIRHGISIVNESGKYFYERGYASAGFADSHFHLPWMGDKLTGLDLTATTGFADLLRKARKHQSSSEWLLGRGWIEESWRVDDLPTLSALDEAFPERPVLFIRKDEHSALINSAGMARCGLTHESDFDAVFLPRLASGRLAGIVRDDALSYVYTKLPKESETDFHTKIKSAISEIVKYGITEIHEMKLEPAQIAMYRNAAATNVLSGLKVTAYLAATLDELRTADIVPFAEGNFSLRGIKFFLDGSFGSCSAAMKEPFVSGANGLLTWASRTEFKDLIQYAATCGLQPAVHAIGDLAVRELLTVYKEVLATLPRQPGLPFRIEHAQCTDEQDLTLFSEFPLVASLQPIHALADEAMCRRLLGEERIHRAYRWRSIVERGPLVIGGSDAPIETHSPFAGIAAFVGREWNPKETIDRQTAIRAFTANPRTATGSSNRRGSLREGFEADLAVIDRDIASCPTAEIADTQVLATFSDGELVYSL